MKNLRTRKSDSYLVISWNYIKESKNYILFIISAFIFSALLGAIFSSELDSILKPFLKDLLAQIEGMGTYRLIIFILQNNAQTAFFAMFLGMFFGIFPFINSIVNGLTLGYVLNNVWEVSGISEFWRILPHGIFELPAVFLALGLGSKLGFDFVKHFVKHYWKDNKLLVIFGILLPVIIFIPLVFDKKFNRREAGLFLRRFKNSVISYFSIIFPLLILAAIIEGILIGIYK